VERTAESFRQKPLLSGILYLFGQRNLIFIMERSGKGQGILKGILKKRILKGNHEYFQRLHVPII